MAAEVNQPSIISHAAPGGEPASPALRAVPAWEPHTSIPVGYPRCARGCASSFLQHNLDVPAGGSSSANDGRCQPRLIKTLQCHRASDLCILERKNKIKRTAIAPKRLLTVGQQERCRGREAEKIWLWQHVCPCVQLSLAV